MCVGNLYCYSTKGVNCCAGKGLIYQGGNTPRLLAPCLPIMVVVFSFLIPCKYRGHLASHKPTLDTRPHKRPPPPACPCPPCRPPISCTRLRPPSKKTSCCGASWATNKTCCAQHSHAAWQQQQQQQRPAAATTQPPLLPRSSSSRRSRTSRQQLPAWSSRQLWSSTAAA